MSADFDFEPLTLREIASGLQPSPDALLQAAILVFSAIAIGLVAQPAPLMRWGYVIGLVSQPLWFIETWRRRQWGMFALSVFYAGAWAQGIHNHF